MLRCKREELGDSSSFIGLPLYLVGEGKMRWKQKTGNHFTSDSTDFVNITSMKGTQILQLSVQGDIEHFSCLNKIADCFL